MDQNNLLVDSCGRRISYLRISLTDRCNLRCRYCIPAGGFPLADRSDILTYEEILYLTECFVALGVDKIRLTGGEPLLRKNLPFLISGLRRFPEIKDISLTTNGIFLASNAKALFEAGLKRITISLDSFHPVKFRWITGLGEHEAVLAGIQAAIRIGFNPVKINVVMMKGINDNEIKNFVALAIQHSLEVRFIELMPARNSFLKSHERFVPNDWVKNEVGRFADLVPESRAAGEVAKVYKIRGGFGKIGFVSSISQSFCAQCNRVRLGSNGALKLCLHGSETFDLRTPLREGASKEELIRFIREAALLKPKGHAFTGTREDEPVVYMCQVGG